MPSAASFTGTDSDDEALDMRQLRHHTKNALQRIIAQVDSCELRRTPKGRDLADEIERRICLSARVSDALFGLRENPGALRIRLESLMQSVVSLMGESEQTIKTSLEIVGTCPAHVHQTVLRVAHEMLGNAVKHGMHMRLAGRIEVLIRSGHDGRTVLSVADDGWGLDGVAAGEGLSLMRGLAARHRGVVDLHRRNHWTVARLELPAPAQA